MNLAMKWPQWPPNAATIVADANSSFHAMAIVDKVHGICRGFFFAKVTQIQYLSGLEALFSGIIVVSKLGMGIAFMMTSNTERKREQM